MASVGTFSIGSASFGRSAMRRSAAGTTVLVGRAARSALTLAVSESTIWLGSAACAWASVFVPQVVPQVTSEGTELARTLPSAFRSK